MTVQRKAIYSALFLTGARVGEVAGLNWADWDKSRQPLGFVGASPISHGAGAGRRRHKDRGAQSVASSQVLGGGFVGLASSISQDNRLFFSGRKSRFCDRNQTAALAGGFFEQSIQAGLEESRFAGQPYAPRFQAQLYYSRFSGRRDSRTVEKLHPNPRDILDQYTHQSWGDFCRVMNSIKLRGQVKAL